MPSYISFCERPKKEGRPVRYSNNSFMYCNIIEYRDNLMRILEIIMITFF